MMDTGSEMSVGCSFSQLNKRYKIKNDINRKASGDMVFMIVILINMARMD